MKKEICHVMKMKTYKTFMEAISQDIALVRDHVKIPLLKAIKTGYFNPTMYREDAEGTVHVAIGKCDHCGDYWVMNTVYFADEDNPGLYMDFIYTETLENSENLVKNAKTTDELANSQYTTFAFENYRRISVYLKPPYTEEKAGEIYVLGAR
jgi:leucyl aminopeptidase (aminopeptidase T)